MRKRTRPVLVGAFILGACLLVVVAIAVWGSGRLLQKRMKYVCYFPGSVHGLVIGAPVKYRGVPIGEVVGMRIRFEQPVDADAHADDLTDGHASVLHGGTDDEPVHRAGEVADVLQALLQQPPRTPHGDCDDDEQDGAEDEGADADGMGSLMHVLLPA